MFGLRVHSCRQILKVFGESADAMGKLKESLATARKLLSNRHKQLQQLWSRSITLRHIIELIDQIESISKVLACVQHACWKSRPLELALCSHVMQNVGQRMVGCYCEELFEVWAL